MKRLSSILVLSLSLVGCSFEPDDDTSASDPKGPIATNAEEAWPSAPASVASFGAEQILAACSRAGECSAEVMAGDAATRTGLVDLCVYDVVFSGERAIPMGGFNQSNERAEYWLGCVLDAKDCAAVSACRTPRDTRIACQEDGCYATEKLSVSCEGSMATLKGSSGTSTRDCSRAFAACDTESPTGCTDRHYTACAKDDAPGDRCDGDIRLGCDGLGQVSYHDCSRLGGSCGTEPDGTSGCVYASECPLDDFGSTSCEAGSLKSCVLGRKLSLPSLLCAEK